MPSLPQIERQLDRCRQNGDARCGVGDLRLKSTISDASVDPVENAQHARMRGLRRPIEVVSELGLCAVDGREPADEPHAQAGQNAEVEVALVGPADQLQRRLAASGVKIAPFEGRIVENAGRLHPGVYVPSAIGRGTRV